MKLLTEETTATEQQRLRLLFESNGILVHLGNEETARNFSFFHPAGRYSIFVIYEEQFEDAVRLMNDEHYIVSNPMDIEHYQQQLDMKKSSTNNTIIIGCLALIAFLLILIYLIS